MGSISPEMMRVPVMAGKFIRSGVMTGIIKDALLTREVHPRDFIEDMRLLSQEQPIQLEGIENIPSDGGGVDHF